MTPKKLQIYSTPISEVVLIATQSHEDERGVFYRGFCDHELDEILMGRTIRQINLSITHQVGTIRGLHFQHPPYAEMKMIRCIQGCVWDVVVDLRKESATFLQWYGVELSGDNKLMIVIPEGCAHGFQSLIGKSELLYLHTKPYVPTAEGGIKYDDPSLKIPWPLAIAEISERDCSFPLLNENYQGIVL
ncbi:dTDP-6-deoxy-L-mannose-dehydrogenase [Gloeomargarita lithophora Alchichica-D10]|uniref:dTDP-6-deoxy-L-mannose-dehydrogenase n=1 Tax=Gloeomargarita lithophora Alchichica-D10 TaxID=1188229 RepID=A0A1J0AB81_9CYAN|nr:dTDP-4-dehydrorhamnose 3,5-epimerase family protein [Gloeomargarita lithophora]APB33173.1 dTDP-6-deoxy-L-mannose-dehydrogenase [Gloeomargarita lithophora Alchichica-D10]